MIRGRAHSEPNMYLAHFPATVTEHGTMPAHLVYCRTLAQLRAALAQGARDVSDDDDAWREIEAELSESY